jgi:hypothetical protein
MSPFPLGGILLRHQLGYATSRRCTHAPRPFTCARGSSIPLPGHMIVLPKGVSDAPNWSLAIYLADSRSFKLLNYLILHTCS